MPNYHTHMNEDEWVIWNGFHGLVTTVTIGRIEHSEQGKLAWLEEPFDMVGPFNLHELEARGRIAFAAALVMSRQRWREDQHQLRQASAELRRAEAERIKQQYGPRYSSHSGESGYRQKLDDKQHRATLKLPLEGKLEARQIHSAFRRLAQKVHPDTGGSNEQFVRISEARKTLLKYIS